MSNYSVTVKEYKTLSKSYDTRFQGYIQAVGNKVLTAATTAADGRILDLGCGTGEILLKLAKNYPNVKELVGIDLSEDMLKLAKTKLGAFKEATVCQGNIEQIPYDDKHFDLVVSSGVLHYVSSPEDMAREVQRVLKPQGHFVLIDMAQESLVTKVSSAFRKLTDPGAVRFYRMQSAIDLLSSQGFKIKSSELFRAGYFGMFLIVAARD